MTKNEAEACQRLLSWYKVSTALCWLEYEPAYFNLQSGQQVRLEPYRDFQIKVLEPVVHLRNIAEIVEFIEERKRNPNL